MLKNIQKHCKKLVFGAACAAAMLTTTGCFGSKTPDRTYFSIDYALAEQAHYTEPKYDASIVIHNFTTSNAYDRQEIVYRSNPYEFQYYWYRLWASKPRKMLREIVSKHLRYTNIFSDVTLAIEDRVPEYEMDVEVTAIEELDASSKDWYAHLAMRMTVSSFEEGTVIWSRDIDVKHNVADNQPVYVVKAMSEIIDTELQSAFVDLDHTLETRQKRAKTTRDRLLKASEEFLDSPEADELLIDEPDTTAETVVNDAPRATLKNKR